MSPSPSLSADDGPDLPEFDTPPPAPMPLARQWLAAATDHDVAEPLSMTLATATPAGVVSARTVDVKSFDDDGLLFGTSTTSPKGRAITANPNGALQVYWRETMQQLRFEGRVVQLADHESDELFAARSPKSRAATAAADQSAPFTDGPEATIADLITAANALLDEHGDDVPRPAGWTAYRLVPDMVEFWHGSRDRMYRRIRYLRVEGGWQVDRLQP
ncbi:pyridoxal 5'-phosphate synthase [Curtobacterium sp. RRHDQ10]|uniref:pyridoxal 5'-phosphate synthase n=1 Tax=Curtobacterium phyllosphaerae TaxID=3413379 RepID=UPI003BF42CAA